MGLLLLCAQTCSSLSSDRTLCILHNRSQAHCTSSPSFSLVRSPRPHFWGVSHWWEAGQCVHIKSIQQFTLLRRGVTYSGINLNTNSRFVLVADLHFFYNYETNIFFRRFCKFLWNVSARNPTLVLNIFYPFPHLFGIFLDLFIFFGFAFHCYLRFPSF